MDIRDENGWSVPQFEQVLSGSCRPYYHIRYRDWDKIKSTIYGIDDTKRRIFVDVGANFGLISVSAKKYFQRIVSIEPHPITAECLRQNMKNEKNGMNTCKYQVIEAAAGKRRGTVDLYCPPTPNTSGYMTILPQENWSKQPVKQISIDSLGLPCCDFMKFDVQGSEINSIAGAEQTIRLYKPFIYVETKEAGDDIIKFLEELGYESLLKFKKGHHILNHKRRRWKS